MAREKTKELLPVMEDNANFVQVIHQTKEEKVAMYMKHSKKEIIEMLIHCNENLELKTTKNEKSANEEQEYINFGCYYNDGGYNTIYKSGCNFEDFKTETLDICKNFSKKDRKDMYNTYNIIKKIIVKLIENGWHTVNAKDAIIEEAIVLDANVKVLCAVWDLMHYTFSPKQMLIKGTNADITTSAHIAKNTCYRLAGFSAQKLNRRTKEKKY